ncbi:hypothetical protein RGC27_08040, partial [Helicobacter pylori]|uniref:hypothetical protein n=1 Tax=Helicobacter pylori TaxID=210 RepID=UPI0029285509
MFELNADGLAVIANSFIGWGEADVWCYCWWEVRNRESGANVEDEELSKGEIDFLHKSKDPWLLTFNV